MSCPPVSPLNQNQDSDSCGKNTKDLGAIFKPKSVAIIGASTNPEKIGHQILKNIIGGGFEGNVFPINRHENQVLGLKTYPTIGEVPDSVDLAIIAIPTAHVLSAMEECAAKNVKSVAVITSGFAEVGKKDEELKLKNVADKANMALIGPNIFGIIYTPSKLNASFGPRDILPGKIAFVSQSGALGIALMGWTTMEKIGLASLVSVGNKADIEEKELIEYFNQDGNVEVILIYMEGIKQGRKFMQTQVKKPVVVLKVGCSQRGAKAAVSHTGSLAGADKIYDAAFKQLGILRAKTFTEAFGWSRSLSLPAPKGEETVIITNGGGIGVRTTDECETADIKILDDPKWLEEKFRVTMPDFGSTKNPVDITGQAKAANYKQAVNIVLREDKINAGIILYCETVITNALDIAKAIQEEYEAVGRNKPIVVAMVGGEKTRDAIYYLNEHHIPAFTSVTQAVSALKVLHTWKDISCRVKDNPETACAPKEAVDLIEKVKKENRNILMEHEARKVLELCGVPTPKWGFATTAEDAVRQAKDMYPLAIKIASVDIVHKTDVGGVILNIRNDEELRTKFNLMMQQVKAAAPKANILGINLIQMVKGIECIVGLNHDPQFGPVVMFGLGGVFVEVLKDVSFRIVPFGKVEAERLINDIKGRKILEGFRGLTANKPSIIQTLCAIQKLAPLVKEIDINPLMTSKDGSYAVDARIVL
ncbi:MAG TPA: acetate--CoA ligase family protein [Candidatus Omnitrophota bacterium]|nr:acetate--CoA ligase family protein [Candidatus Omnitrophota bacterium]HPD84885.1 acetate--CoA ligase family protein [Candidatus Omnitrophota bacterium]HRZ03743.1 acetate--CoA ligase family protein [Candidatus Omnitrophota bacterium]